MSHATIDVREIEITTRMSLTSPTRETRWVVCEDGEAVPSIPAFRTRTEAEAQARIVWICRYSAEHGCLPEGVSTEEGERALA